MKKYDNKMTKSGKMHEKKEGKKHESGEKKCTPSMARRQGKK